MMLPLVSHLQTPAIHTLCSQICGLQTVGLRRQLLKPLHCTASRKLQEPCEAWSIAALRRPTARVAPGTLCRRGRICVRSSAEHNTSELRVGFIGAGKMSEALARGFIAGGIVRAENIVGFSPSSGRKQAFRDFGARAVDSNAEVVNGSQVVFIGVKPPMVTKVLNDIKGCLTDSHVVVSIAAGVTLAHMQEAAGEDVRLVRVMPNTPCQVGEAAAAMCLGVRAESRDAETVQSLMDAVGTCIEVDEKLFSGVVGVSGSCPAYVFLMIEALADGGVRTGLPRSTAQALAAQTVLGAAKMVLQTGQQPGKLKDDVTSPAGTTIAAVHELERGAFRSTIMNAVLAAATRSDEMSQQ